MIPIKKALPPWDDDSGESYWAIRFGSSNTEAFTEVKDEIKAYGKPLAEWHADSKVWVIATSVLLKVYSRFSNFNEMANDEIREILANAKSSKQQHIAIPSRHIPFYTILGLSLDRIATSKEIQEAYRAKSKIYHPDTGGAHPLMVALNYAYDQVKG